MVRFFFECFAVCDCFCSFFSFFVVLSLFIYNLTPVSVRLQARSREDIICNRFIVLSISYPYYLGLIHAFSACIRFMLAIRQGLSSFCVYFINKSLPGASRVGPAPLEAVKRGDIGIGYDTAFVFAEVNSDKCYWLHYGRSMIFVATDADE